MGSDMIWDQPYSIAQDPKTFRIGDRVRISTVSAPGRQIEGTVTDWDGYRGGYRVHHDGAPDDDFEIHDARHLHHHPEDPWRGRWAEQDRRNDQLRRSSRQRSADEIISDASDAALIAEFERRGLDAVRHISPASRTGWYVCCIVDARGETIASFHLEVPGGDPISEVARREAAHYLQTRHVRGVPPVRFVLIPTTADLTTIGPEVNVRIVDPEVSDG